MIHAFAKQIKERRIHVTDRDFERKERHDQLYNSWLETDGKLTALFELEEIEADVKTFEVMKVAAIDGIHLEVKLVSRP